MSKKPPSLEVLSCPNSPQGSASSPPIIDVPLLVSLPASKDSDDLICFEEINYQESGNDEESAGAEYQQLQSVDGRYCDLVSSSSPSTPWLSSKSPQITSIFATNWSPPMQLAPKLHHLSPPPQPMYSPFPNMYNFDDGSHWVPGDASIQQ